MEDLNIIKTAKAMLQDKVEDEIFIKYTNISKEKIEEIKKEISN